MPITPLPPPQSDQELLARCRAIAGRSLADLAGELGVAVPADLNRHKGWVGQVLELGLGADAGSLAEPDFRGLGIELKTLPLDASGQPRESTYVCTVPLEGAGGETWERSWVRRKLARVLWVPVEADRAIPLADRRIGNALLWSPGPEEEAVLRADWEELMDMICLGDLEHITARLGTALQIRPKAANARVLCRAVGPDGGVVLTNPRGFYLRPSFTRAILRRHYATSAYRVNAY